jgi:tetratricopeptide (TPR) repeat protein/TolB-like protein
MPVSDWDRIKSIFADAVELSPAERVGFIAKACAGDDGLREAVERLLAHSASTNSLSILPSPRHTLAPGDLVSSRFRIRNFLGNGGMGEVYVADDLELGGCVALKTLRPALNEDQQFLARFRREVQLARQVTHPSICRVFDVGSDRVNGVPLVFLTMEFLDGETLSQRLRRTGGLGEEAALPLIQNMVEGLGALHDAGVIHRDFKPGNVMLVRSRTGAERAVITDFGLARDLESEPGFTLTQANQVMGTPAYMAPEQFQGQRATRQSDIYALGVVMYEAVTGKHPFHSNGDREANVKPTPGLLSPPLDAAILKCLAINPKDRPQSVSEIPCVTQNPTGMSPATGSTSIQPDKPKASRRNAVVAGASVVVLVMAIAIWAWFFRQAGPALPEKKLVAVLPFQTFNDDRELRALSDGMAEMLSSKLTQLEPLQASFAVVPASEIRSRKIDSVERARTQYGVNLAVTGSIQRLGNSMQFTANLVDAVSLRQLRAISFDAGEGDIKALRDGIVNRVVGLLEVQITPKSGEALDMKETDRAQAYFAYLEGRGYLYRFDVAGNVDRAIESLEKALREDPNYALCHAALGEAYWRKALSTNDKIWADRAMESARKAVQLGGTLAVPHIKLGEIYAQSGRHQEAIREFQVALKSQPGNADAYRGLGRTYAAIGLNQDAENAYLQAARLRPNDWYAHNLLGVFYYGQGKYDSAERAWIRARDLTPDNDYPYRNLGMLYLATGRLDQARVQFERSIAIKPSFLAHIGLGDLSYYADKPRDAIVQYNKAVLFEPNNHVGWGGIGDAYTQISGSTADAKAAYAKAIMSCERKLALSPNDLEIQANLACYHAKTGQKAKALEILARVTDAPSLDLATRFAIALTHEVIGERRLAVKEFEALLRDGRPPTQIRADPYLKQLKNDAEFAPILQKYRVP